MQNGRAKPREAKAEEEKKQRMSANIEHRTSNIQHPLRRSQHQAKAESRKQKAEMGAKSANAIPMRPECDIKATSKRVDSQPIGTPMRP